MKKWTPAINAGAWVLLLITLVGLPQLALADYEVNMPRGVTDISNEVYRLHMLIFWICVAIGIVVFGAMFWSMMFHRKSRGHKAASFHHSTTVEIIWTVIPFLILVAMAIPAARTLIAMESTGSSDMTIKVTGYQWKWRYEYLDGPSAGIDFFSMLSTPLEQINGPGDPMQNEHYLLEVDNPLVVPTNTKIRFLLTSGDVIHAWWVPDFAVKKDAVPGFINEMWTYINEPGVYRGQCAELCGKDHGFMPIVVIAKEPSEYLAWVEQQTGEPAALVAQADVEPAAPVVEPAPVTEAEEEEMDLPDAAASMADTAAGVVAPTADDIAVTEEDQSASAADDTAATAEATEAAEAAPEAATSGADLASVMDAGEKVYSRMCIACHQANGQGLPPAFPAIAGSEVVLGDLAAQVELILNGKPGTAMVAFGPQLNDDELAAVITYQRNAFGNDTGDLVTPDQIKALR